VSGVDTLESSVVVVELGVTGVPFETVVAGGRLSDVVFEVTDVGAAALEAEVIPDSDWCRPVEPQPAARRVLMATAEAAVMSSTGRMLTVSAKRSGAAMGRAPLRS
jgi:hypothetical protein